MDQSIGTARRKDWLWAWMNGDHEGFTTGESQVVSGTVRETLVAESGDKDLDGGCAHVHLPIDQRCLHNSVFYHETVS
jgi:hypothetical protein